MKNGFIILCILFLYTQAGELQCNKMNIEFPRSEFDCSGLEITNSNGGNDTHCCIWTYIDNDTNEKKARCSSIDQKQFNNLTAYIERKKKNYTELDIKCTEDQKLYCSNMLYDQESINDCRTLKISQSSDSYCCRWKFKDYKNNNKKMNYCASISEYQYITIEEYIKYKENKKSSKYSDLSIDCSAKLFNIFFSKYLFLILLIELSYI